MESVGPGTVLAGRYHAQQRVHQATWSSIWQALDETLDRPVSLRVVDQGHPRGADVVDAARRAAGVEDPRLQRILDVGTQDGLTYVVCEWVGADSMTDLLRSGTLPPDEVRRLVGEAATALEAARHRGLHHLALTPDVLLRGHDGPVTVTGLAVDAALAGTEVVDAAVASRLDTRALVALIYAGLTGRWPLDPVPGLEPPPRVGSALPAASEIAAGVPADLDALCRQTLRDGDGPDDPGRLATLLAPWPAGPVVGPNRTIGSFPIHLGADSAPATTVIPAVGAGSVQAVVNTPRPPTPPAPPVRPPATHVPPRQPEPEPAAPPATAAAAAAAAAESLPSGVPAASTWPPLPVIRPGTAGTPGPAPAAPAGPQPVAPPAPVPATPAPAAHAASVPPPTPAFGSGGGPLDAASPAPLLPATSTARPPDSQTRAVLAVVGAFVLILCLLAYLGLRSFGGGGGKARPTGAGAKPSSSATATPAPSAGASAGAGSGAATGAVLSITSAKGFDPQGDNSEKDNLAKLAYDSKRSSGWTSDTYKNSSWGGLKKGVGLRLNLGSPKTVHSATLRIGGTGAKLQLLAVDGSGLSGAKLLAKSSDASGTLTLTVAKPASTQYVVIWFTTPGKFGDGYRAEVDDVQLR